MAPRVRNVRQRGGPSWGGGISIDPAALVVTPATATIEEGATQQLTAAVRNAAGVGLNNFTVSYASDDESVATVNSAGLVTAIVAGEAVITAVVVDHPTLTDTVAVTVEAP